MMKKNPASFRDATNFIFHYNEEIFRAIHKEKNSDYDALVQSKLFDRFHEKKWLLPHKEVQLTDRIFDGYTIIQPTFLPIVSYPYEWCFSQLKESALLTLDICTEALREGFILKDASAYNVQLFSGQCIFIDSMSLSRYEEGKPWEAYRQYIMHFLAPLLLMKHVSIELNSLFRIYNEGIPLQLTKKLLPTHAFFHPFVFLTIYLHEKFERKYSTASTKKSGVLPKKNLHSMLLALREMTAAIRIKPKISTWSEYTENNNYEEKAIQRKEEIILNMVSSLPKLKKVLDMGANTGRFSRLLQLHVDHIISADFDPYAVEKNYQLNRSAGHKNIYPLWIDIRNPSSGVGWEGKERSSFLERTQSDLILFLALIHHLVITENIPLEKIAQMLASQSTYLLIEFVGTEDSQVKLLYQTKKPNHSYNMEKFEQAFYSLYEVKNKTLIEGTERTLYLLQRKPCI